MAAVAVVVLLLLAARYVPYVLDARTLSASAHQLADRLRESGPGDVDRAFIESIGADVWDLRSRTDRMGQFLRDDPLVGALRSVSSFSATLNDADTLLAATGDVLTAAELALPLGERFVALREAEALGGGSLLAGMVGLIAESSTAADDIRDHLSSAADTLTGVSATAPGDIREAADLMGEAIDRYLPVIDLYRSIDDGLPPILGHGEARRYLVLAQNPAELRPTGGYTGTIGVVEFEGGDLVGQNFQDVYQLDLKPGIPFVEPPQGLQDHLLGSASWQLADANWSPDFPTSAQDALRLYTLESGDSDIDGVIGLNTYAIDRLMEVTGPIRVPEYDVTVRPGQVTLTALSLTRGISTPTSDRKAFLDELAATLLDRLFTLPASDWVSLYEAFGEISERRMLLTWFADDAAQALVAGSPIAGEVHQGPGDHLFVVEANVAPTSKYNLVVRRRADLDVVLAPDGSAQDHLRLTWQNDAGGTGEPYESLRSYSTSMVGVYGTYVRVLAAPESVLTETRGTAVQPITEAESVSVEAGRATFANYLLIAPGPARLEYRWAVPAAAQQAVDGEWRYRLTVQKQPGMLEERFAATITLPPGSVPTTVPDGATVDGEVVTISTILETDHVLEIGYRLP